MMILLVLVLLGLLIVAVFIVLELVGEKRTRRGELSASAAPPSLKTSLIQPEKRWGPLCTAPSQPTPSMVRRRACRRAPKVRLSA
jgi:hypothetical protein